MKKLKIILILLIMIFLMPFVAISATVNDNSLRDRIDKIGLEDTYEDNILEYVQDLRMDKEKLQKLEVKSKELINEFSKIKDNTNITLDNIKAMYDYLMDIGTVLNLKVDYSILKDSLTLTDNDTSTILLKANKNELFTYLQNIKSNFLGEENKEFLKEMLVTYNVDENIEDYYTESNFDYEVDNREPLELVEEYKNEDTDITPNNISTANTVSNESENEDTPSNKLYFLGIFMPLVIIGLIGIFKIWK